MTLESPVLEYEQDDRRLVLTHRRSRLRLAFTLRDLVWAHAVDFPPHPGSPAAVLASVEAAPDAAPNSIPPSPSYQELHYDPVQQPQQVLLVGKFGPHHYSAVFSLREETSPDSAAGSLVLDVDVADRCRALASTLSVVYAVREVGSLSVPQANQVVFSVPGSEQELLRLDAPVPAAIQVRPQGPGTGMLVQCAVTPDPTAGTHRLRYALRFPLHD